MTEAELSRTVLFLTSPDDALPREFAAERAGYELAFLFGQGGPGDWCIAWVCDDRGEVQAWLEHIPSAQSHFLGSDAQQAMRSAARMITEWDKLEQSFAVQ